MFQVNWCGCCSSRGSSRDGVFGSSKETSLVEATKRSSVRRRRHGNKSAHACCLQSQKSDDALPFLRERNVSPSQVISLVEGSYSAFFLIFAKRKSCNKSPPSWRLHNRFLIFAQEKVATNLHVFTTGFHRRFLWHFCARVQL